MLKCFVCIGVFVMVSVSSTTLERGPRLRIFPRQSKSDTLMLPSNATSIRENITDTFSCENKTYGYYADVDNDCQIFHVCLPVTYADERNQTFKWSFICPEETIFDQGVFVCVRDEDSSIRCEDSEDYYSLNENFGMKEQPEPEEENESAVDSEENMEEEKKTKTPTQTRKKTRN